MQTCTLTSKKRFQTNVSMKFCFSKYFSAGCNRCIVCYPVRKQAHSGVYRYNKEVVVRFHKAVESGPDYVCKCCFQTWFKAGVCHATSVPENDWVCNTCYKYLKSSKIPPCSYLNGLKFPVKPTELDLTPLEERLVAPRIPFMQLREKPRGGQLSILGNVVNVPADVSSTVKMLPRLLSENETIALKFKRSLSFKHSVSFERIRPVKVISAAKWLVKNSKLFQDEGIQVNEEWLSRQQFDENENDNIDYATDSNTESNSEKVVEKWSEETNLEDRPTGNMDTVMQSLDFREFNDVLCVAPGEKNSPLSIFQDKYSEFLAFPTIYCGQVRPENKSRSVPLH